MPHAQTRRRSILKEYDDMIWVVVILLSLYYWGGRGVRTRRRPFNTIKYAPPLASCFGPIINSCSTTELSCIIIIIIILPYQQIPLLVSTISRVRASRVFCWSYSDYGQPGPYSIVVPQSCGILCCCCCFFCHIKPPISRVRALSRAGISRVRPSRLVFWRPIQ